MKNDETTKKLVSYVAAVEPHMRKLASYESDETTNKVVAAIDTFVESGIIEPTMKKAAVSAVLNDPSEAVELLSKAADALSVAQSAGNASVIKSASETEISKEDAFDAKLMGESGGIVI